jgi:hypothetical protein
MWTMVPKYTTELQLRIIRLQYSTERICAPIGEISTFRCALHCKLGAKCSTHHPVYAVWTVVPDMYNVVAAPHVQSPIFNWTYLRCYCRYHINSMRVILQTWRKYSAHPPVYAMWAVVPEIYNVITAQHIQVSIFNCTYLRCYRRYSHI